MNAWRLRMDWSDALQYPIRSRHPESHTPKEAQ